MLSCGLLFPASSCVKDSPDNPRPGVIPLLEFELTGTFPHDTNSFTEGLLYLRDTLFESTGWPSGFPACRSVFGPVERATGRIDVKADLTSNGYFGEGIAFLDGKFFQLTYLDGTGFIYDASTYAMIGQFPVPGGEGWGLTTDGEVLIMSDGTDKLTCFDPQNFQITNIVHVTEGGSPKWGLNELEFVNGHVYANIWLGKKVVKIDLPDGTITGEIDLGGLAEQAQKKFPGSMSMNGIAFDPGRNHFFITGKRWPDIYEITLINTGP